MPYDDELGIHIPTITEADLRKFNREHIGEDKDVLDRWTLLDDSQGEIEEAEEEGICRIDLLPEEEYTGSDTELGGDSDSASGSASELGTFQLTAEQIDFFRAQEAHKKKFAKEKAEHRRKLAEAAAIAVDNGEVSEVESQPTKATRLSDEEYKRVFRDPELIRKVKKFDRGIDLYFESSAHRGKAQYYPAAPIRL